MIPNKVRWGLLSTARINERLIPCLRASARSELLAVATILDGAAPVIPLSDSQNNVAAIVALLKSARENRPIDL